MTFYCGLTVEENIKYAIRKKQEALEEGMTMNLDRKDYPKEKLDAMVAGMEAARFLADRGSRDEYIKSEFMWAALLAGERWDAEASQRHEKEKAEFVAKISTKKDQLIEVKKKMGQAIEDGKFSEVTDQSYTAHVLQREIADLQKTAKARFGDNA